MAFDIKEIRLTAAAIFSCSVNYFIKKLIKNMFIGISIISYYISRIQKKQ